MGIPDGTLSVGGLTVNIANTQQPLFTPVRMGKLELPNRIVMAPLTRMRAANPEHAPTELHAEYYAQRWISGASIPVDRGSKL